MSDDVDGDGHWKASLDCACACIDLLRGRLAAAEAEKTEALRSVVASAKAAADALREVAELRRRLDVIGRWNASEHHRDSIVYKDY